MAVTLQVIGLYYKQSLNIPFNNGPTVTVKDVLDYAIQQGMPNGNFFYSPGQGAQEQYVNFFTVEYYGVFSSPVSGNTYLPGMFTLQQTFTQPGMGNYTVWQYYVRDQNGNNIVIPGGPELPFGQANVVQDGYTVIWRLVEICNAIPAPMTQPGQAVASAPGNAGVNNVNARFARVIGKPRNKAKV